MCPCVIISSCPEHWLDLAHPPPPFKSVPPPLCYHETDQQQEEFDWISWAKQTSLVNDYNKYMGGCDLGGQLCKYYTHNHRTLKWWKRLFVTILDICLLKATIVYNSIPTNSRLSGLEFRVKVIEGLLSTWKYNPAQHANQLSSSRPSRQPSTLSWTQWQETELCCMQYKV